MPEPALLAVEGLQAWYGESHVLHGVSFDVRVGEVVTLLGRNGAGKTTTLKSIMGIVGHRTGSVRFEGRELVGCASNEIARAGIALCPEERGIFSSLSVEENLLLPPVVKPGGLGLDRIFTLFPNLKERLGSSQGSKLSGGEQQMLAIGRILRTGARLLLLDEPTEGLAPVIIQQIGRTIRPSSRRASPFFWSSRISASHRPSPIAISSWNTAESSKVSSIRNWTPTSKSCTTIWEYEPAQVSGDNGESMPVSA